MNEYKETELEKQSRTIILQKTNNIYLKCKFKKK